jgi:acyl-CoA synthetase (AMP-forming)/AMP-acid ligase II
MQPVTAQARAHLPRTSRPAHITVLPTLPALPSGKIDVPALLWMAKT